MTRPVTLAVAEVIVYFLSAAWLMTLALMVREVVLLWLQVSSMVIVTDVPWSYIWLALRSDWSWLWS